MPQTGPKRPPLQKGTNIADQHGFDPVASQLDGLWFGSRHNCFKALVTQQNRNVNFFKMGTDIWSSIESL